MCDQAGREGNAAENQEMGGCEAYLQSLLTDLQYATWETKYAPIGVKGKASAELADPNLPPEFALQVGFWAGSKTTRLPTGPRLYPSDAGSAGSEFLPSITNQRIPALEALRKYASDHVLLVGRPGSGKTTILRKLLLEQAKAASEKPSERIPILVELKFMTGSVEERIRKFLDEHGWRKSLEEVDGYLNRGEFLLLIDGLNELPPETEPRDLEDFRRHYRKTTPMIFTSRDVGAGYPVGVEMKFELLPLDKADVETFVKKYLPPDEAASLLAALDRGRLRDLSEIAMFLQMLCAKYSAEQELPLNPAQLFRGYLKDFYPRELKRDIRGTAVPKSDWYELVAYLAFRMLEGPSVKDRWRSIPISHAEEIFEDWFRRRNYAYPRENAGSSTKELLEYHVIQLNPEGELGFPHDLIQEFFAAEYLLEIWRKADENVRKRKFLNHLKWTEPLCLMMGLVDSDQEAALVVRSAFEVDATLAARLAGSAQPQIQRRALALLDFESFHNLCQLQILAQTRSDEALPGIRAMLLHGDSGVRSMVVRAVGAFAPELALPLLREGLQDEDSEIRAAAVSGLSHTRTEAALALIDKTLQEDESESVRFTAILSLASYGNPALPHLKVALQHNEWWYRYAATVATGALGLMGVQETVPLLEQAFLDKHDHVRLAAGAMLGKIAGEASLPLVEQALRSEDPKHRATAMGGLGFIGSEVALAVIEKALQDEDIMVRGMAIAAIESIPSQTAILMINKILQSEQPWLVRRMATRSLLGRIGTEGALQLIARSLEDEDPGVREEAAGALLGANEKVLAFLLKEVEDLFPALTHITHVLLDPKGADSVEFVEEWFRRLPLPARLTIVGMSSFDQARGLGIFKVPVDQGLLDSLITGEIFGDMDSEIYRGLVRLDDPRIIGVLRARWQLTGDENCLASMESIQGRYGFYSLDFVENDRRISVHRTFRFLHLSDLHFCEKGQGLRWFTHLVQDLESVDLRCQETGIDGLVISGDIAFQCKEEGYAEARVFIDQIKDKYSIEPTHIVVVPGNHDVSRLISQQQGYHTKARDDAQEDLKRSRCIDRGDLVEVPIQEELERRFESFRKFYKHVLNRVYPLASGDQWELVTFAECKILVLGLNSAWQTDHYFTQDASINDDALSRALIKIHNEYQDWKKIAAWHHPLVSAEESRIKEHEFLGRMAKEGFRLVLHGHVHKFDNDYVLRVGIEPVAAGTFGAPRQELRPAYPWEYNLIEIKDDTVRINTRMRRSLTGPWERFANWRDPDGPGNLWYYEFDF